jgi:hypothetical protein
MRKIFEDHGMNCVSISVRAKNRVKASRGQPALANRSWALVEFIDPRTACRAQKAKVMVDDDSGHAVSVCMHCQVYTYIYINVLAHMAPPCHLDLPHLISSVCALIALQVALKIREAKVTNISYAFAAAAAALRCVCAMRCDAMWRAQNSF